MFCEKCGQKLETNSNFCGSCGHAIDGHKEQKKVKNKAVNKKEELSGFSGWLALFGLGIMLTPLIFIFYWMEAYNEYGFDAYTYAVYLVLVASAIWINYLMFTRKRSFKKWFVGFAILNIAISLLAIVANNMDPYLYTEAEKEALLGDFIKAVIYGIAWSTYLWVSERARNTFVN